MDQSKLYIPTPAEIYRFLHGWRKGSAQTQTAIFIDGEKPTSEKMRTELVSPTERSLEQVADRLKRKRSIKSVAGSKFVRSHLARVARRGPKLKDLKFPRTSARKRRKLNLSTEWRIYLINNGFNQQNFSEMQSEELCLFGMPSTQTAVEKLTFSMLDLFRK